MNEMNIRKIVTQVTTLLELLRAVHQEGNEGYFDGDGGWVFSHLSKELLDELQVYIERLEKRNEDEN